MVRKALFTLLIVAIWCTFTGLKVKHYYQPPQETTYVAQAYREKVGVSEYHYGVYLRDIRMGHLRRMILPTEGGFKLFEEGTMRMTFLGEKREVRMSLYGDLDGDFRLKAFSLQVASDKDDLIIRGQMAHTILTLTIAAGQQRTTHTIALKERPLLPSAIVPYLVKSGFSGDGLLRLSVFDPSIIGEYGADIGLIGWEKVKVEGEEVRAFHVKTLFKGIELHAWVDESGGIVKEVSPIGLVVQKEREGKPSDYLDVNLLATVETTGTVADARGASFLRARLEAGEDLRKVVGRYQKVDGDIMEIERGAPSRVSPDPEGSLAATPFISSDDPAIISALPAITGPGADPGEKARAIARWVHDNMTKAPTFSVPIAREVFRKRVGDCNEHAVLFAALARAAGVPSVIASGMVFNDGRFYYHAWNLVHLKGRWTSVDATFGQFPADATHIVLALGDITDGIDVLQFVHKTKIHILEVR